MPVSMSVRLDSIVYVIFHKTLGSCQSLLRAIVLFQGTFHDISFRR